MAAGPVGARALADQLGEPGAERSLVAALIFVFRPDGSDGGGDSAFSLSGSVADTAVFEQIGQDIEAHDGKITSMVTAPTDQGPMLYTTGADKTVAQWNLETGELVERITFAYFTEILGAAFHGIGTRQPSRPICSPFVRKNVGSSRTSSGRSSTSFRPSSSPW